FVSVRTQVQYPNGFIDVTPGAPQLAPGGTVALTAAPRDVLGKPTTWPVTWGTNNPSVATVSGSGVVTAVSLGSATITATSGAVNGSAAVSVVAPGSMIADAGNLQTAHVGAAVATAPRIRLLDGSANPRANVP